MSAAEHRAAAAAWRSIAATASGMHREAANVYAADHTAQALALDLLIP